MTARSFVCAYRITRMAQWIACVACLVALPTLAAAQALEPGRTWTSLHGSTRHLYFDLPIRHRERCLAHMLSPVMRCIGEEAGDQIPCRLGIGRMPAAGDFHREVAEGDAGVGCRLLCAQHPRHRGNESCIIAVLRPPGGGERSFELFGLGFDVAREQCEFRSVQLRPALAAFGKYPIHLPRRAGAQRVVKISQIFHATESSRYRLPPSADTTARNEVIASISGTSKKTPNSSSNARTSLT